MSVAPAERLDVQGLWARPFQKFLTVAGMIAVVTAVLAGSAVGVLAAAASDGSLVASLIPGAASGLVTLICLMRFHQLAWRRGGARGSFRTANSPSNRSAPPR